jgi:glycosyltransferase involved in cell wall biosynthesis
MNVAFICLTEETYRKFHHRWVDDLMSDGHTITWISEDWGEKERLEQAGVDFRETPIARNPYPRKVLRSWWELHKTIRDVQPDVIVSEGTIPSLLARYVTIRDRFSQIKILHSWPWHDEISDVLEFVGRNVERIASRRTDHFVVISKEDHQYGLDYGLFSSEESTQQAVGIDPDLYSDEPSEERKAAVRSEFNIDPKTFTYLFVGRMVEYKGIFDVVEAFENVYTVYPDSELVMVGTPEEYEHSQQVYCELLSRVEDSPAQDAITIIDFVEDLPALYSVCDVFVMPSLYEGLGLVYIEANAMNLPTIGYNVRGVREAIKDGTTGFLVSPEDIGELSDKMRILKENRQLREKFGANGQNRWHPNFDNNKFAEIMKRVIRYEV